MWKRGQKKQWKKRGQKERGENDAEDS